MVVLFPKYSVDFPQVVPKGVLKKPKTFLNANNV